MILTHLDHLVVTAPTLEAGAEWIRQSLGAELRPGGAHARMGTHNLLLRLSADVYLEVIASDPVAPSPGRPRWFGLDELSPNSRPRLAAWVGRTNDLLGVVAASPYSIGPIEPMSRDVFNWQITVPTDGSLPFGGAGPLLIQWDSFPHPALRLPDDGYSLVRLDVTHPRADRFNAMLEAIGFQGPVIIGHGESIELTAIIMTPLGKRRLSSILGPAKVR